jgi:hypothetical protein
VKAVIAAWAGLLALWTVVQLAFSPEPISLILLGGAALAVALLAAAARPPKREHAPDLSPATVVVALGVAALLSGTSLGQWCLGLGVLLTAAGLAGLVAER